ncbi:MAG: MATE family efflux transporter [Clostridiaceae bacterium]
MKKINLDKNFYKKLFVIGIPIMIQNLISSSLNMVDTLMIGKLGDESIAAVGLSNQVFFLFTLILFGVFSGASIFTAQFYGKKDIKNIRRVLSVCLMSGIFVAIIFTFFVLVFPKEILGIFSKDLKVINLGADYIFIVGFSYILTSISFAYSFSARSIGQAKIPMVVSGIALACNTILNYILIFGEFGFPELGVKGAAYATLISRIVEIILILSIVYKLDLAIAARWKDLCDVSLEFILKIYKTAFPVIINESFWALGMTAYSRAYARMSTEAIASVQIGNSVQNLFLVFSMGLGNACAVMLGHEIGKGKEENAIAYSKKYYYVGFIISIILGVVLFFSANNIISYFNVSDKVAKNSVYILKIISLFLWAKTFNMITIVGVLRSGGDTKFAMFTELGTIWLYGVPIVMLSALYFKFPIYIVILLANFEEVIKLFIGIPRVISKKWVNNIIEEID